MNRPYALLAFLCLMALLPAHAEEPSVCTSMCSAEKQQCTKQASRLTGLDKLPPVEEKNGFAYTANRGQVQSTPDRAQERSDFYKRKRERLDACDTSYRSCTRACTPPASPVVARRAGAT